MLGEVRPGFGGWEVGIDRLMWVREFGCEKKQLSHRGWQSIANESPYGG